jgi:L-lactate dehydrogenase complex protein LldG
MSKGSRERIFSRLNAATRHAPAPVSQPPEMPAISLSQEEKIEKLKTLMEAMRTEVHITAGKNWLNTMENILKEREIKSLLYAPDTDIGKALAHRLQSSGGDLPQLIAYEKEIDNLKEAVFKVEAGITSAAGAIAETGALILWPSDKEPRLMSIVPTVHIAILKADTIYNTLSEVMQQENWPAKMPTNVVLLSGPSKTADIEMTLAFGVHGPRELILLILQD